MGKKRSGHRMTFRVPFSDVDMAGIVYTAKFSDYMLKGWEQYFADIGIPWESYVGKKEVRGLPVITMSIEFKSPARCGEQLSVITKVSRLTNRRIYFSFDILNDGTNRLVARGKITVSAFGKDFRPIPIPDFIVHAINSTR